MRLESLMAERIRSRVSWLLLSILSPRLSILVSMSSILVLLLSILTFVLSILLLIETFRLSILLSIGHYEKLPLPRPQKYAGLGNSFPELTFSL